MLSFILCFPISFVYFHLLTLYKKFPIDSQFNFFGLHLDGGLNVSGLIDD